ncbi:MAG: serine hydrolase [Dethiobacter sp.]|nr:serine hydrolase [Dethiobacter sp.]MBS3899627.1 serine hydrolase [Dethiobacter sp.]
MNAQNRQLALALLLIMTLLAAYSFWFDSLFPLARKAAQEKVTTAEQLELALPETTPANPTSEREKKGMTPAAAESWALAQLSSNEMFLFSLYDFETGETFNHNGDVRVFPASLIKTLILLVFLDEVNQGRQSLDNLHILGKYDHYAAGNRVKGTGFLRFKPPGIQYAHWEILSLMISESDNVATNIIIRLLGKELINRRAQAYGLTETKVARLIFERGSRASILSTMNDLTALLVLLENRKLIDGELYNKAILLHRNAKKHRIGKYAASELVVANKIGDTSNRVADMALIYFPDRKPLALSVMIKTRDGSRISAERNDEIIARFAKYLLDYYLP